VVGVNGFGCIPPCDLRLHNEAPRAFAKRLSLRRSQSCDEGIAEMASLYQGRGCPLKRFQSQHTVTLPVSHYPFVIPVRQKFDTLDQERELSQRHQVWLIDQSLGKIQQLSDVHCDIRVQAKAIATSHYKVGLCATDTPQRSAEALSRGLVGAISPKSAGHPGPRYRPVSQGKIGQQTLGTMWNPQVLSTDDQVELSYEGQSGRRLPVVASTQLRPRRHDPHIPHANGPAL
jgi:hypothetical protein